MYKLETFALLVLLLLALTACGQEATPEPATATPIDEPTPTAAPTDEPTPAPTATPEPVALSYAAPESQGISPEALEQLAAIARGYFEDGLIVGAELVVIKDRRTVLHEAIGWKDQDTEAPMERNTLFNIRSMTKPVIGTAIQMLVDEGKLALDDRVSQYLPAFEDGKSGQITIEHLLTHRSGLPLTLLGSFEGIANIQDVAEQAGEYEPDFKPGSAFRYSDSGSDTLGAVLEKACGLTIDRLLEQRIIGPLAMSDTITLLGEGEPRSARIASAYVGSVGDWSRFWGPDDEPLYPFAMGSQGLYCTPLDYARFLALWMDGGLVGERRLLSPQAVERAMRPVSEMGAFTSFHGLRVDYGQMWSVYVEPDAPAGTDAALFGHSGSDGTWAWAWPEQDLIILYFTQSRGQMSGTRLEREIERLLIHPGAEQSAALPKEYEPYLGTYTALSGPMRNTELTVLAQDGRLAVDIPIMMVFELLEPDARGKWRFAQEKALAVSFEQDEAGDVVAITFYEGPQAYKLPRGVALPEPELDLDEVQKCLGFYHDEEAGHDIEVLVHNEHLAFEVPEQMVILELYPPDEDGWWELRVNPGVAVRFDESEDGRIESFTVRTREGETVHPRVEH